MPQRRADIWIAQARADLEASRVNTGYECHQRYWLQQACEKGIKALGIVIWRPESSLDGLFRKYFLHKHSPIAQLRHDLNGSSDPDLVKNSRRFTLLLKQLEADLGKLDGGTLLLKVDSTTPTPSPTDVSYRYPFRDSTKNLVAPRDWTTTDWDAYQGNAMGIERTIKRFLREVENQYRVSKRAP
jgi:hypothetical protein